MVRPGKKEFQRDRKVLGFITCIAKIIERMITVKKVSSEKRGEMRKLKKDEHFKNFMEIGRASCRERVYVLV